MRVACIAVEIMTLSGGFTMTIIGKENAIRILEGSPLFDDFEEAKEYIISLIRKDIEADGKSLLKRKKEENYTFKGLCLEVSGTKEALIELVACISFENCDPSNALADLVSEIETAFDLKP